MLTRNQIMAFLGLAVSCWVILLLVRGIPVTVDMLLPFSGVVGFVSLALAIFNKWLWHWPIINGWLINRPWIQGTWRVHLQSDWINSDTGEGIAAITGYMVVRETASALSLRLFTAESRSETVSSGIECCTDGTFEVTCAYRNKPKAEYRDRSEVHYGAMLLTAGNRNPFGLEGDYWTDRKTTGSISLSDRRRKLASSFGEAEKIFHS